MKEPYCSMEDASSRCQNTVFNQLMERGIYLGQNFRREVQHTLSHHQEVNKRQQLQMDQMLQSIEALLILGNLTEMADTITKISKVLFRLKKTFQIIVSHSSQEEVAFTWYIQPHNIAEASNSIARILLAVQDIQIKPETPSTRVVIAAAKVPARLHQVNKWKRNYKIRKTKKT